MKQNFLVYGIKVFALFIVYLVTARFGLSLDAVNSFATLVWLPSGLSLVALFLFGYRYWPGIFLGAIFANILTGAHPLVALGIGTGNTLEALLGTVILKHTGFNSALESLKDVLLLVFATTPLSTAVSATIGVLSLLMGGSVSVSAIYVTWQAWWIGDMISFIIFAPFLFMWYTLPTEKMRLKRITEILLLSLTVIFIGLFVFRGIFGIQIKNSPITYLVFPPLIWAALRFGQKGAITVVTALSTLAIIATIQGYSPFANGRLSDRLLLLQSFMGVIAITTMILAAVDSERQRLEQRKDEFISLASHELKTPLTSVKAFVQILGKKFSNKLDVQTLNYLKKMDMQIDKLTLLINSLLDVSKVQAGKLEFQKEHFSLTVLINDTIEVLQASTPTHKIITKNLFNKTPFTVYADKERINQVVINLLTNAIKYSPKKRKIIVTILKKRNKVHVCVQDFGIGMTPEQQRNIFQRYYRGHTNNDKTFLGLGLGLYISHEIIKYNNGEIWLQSKQGLGSTFYFALPLSNFQK